MDHLARSKDYLVRETPERCLESATAYLVGKGYHVETQTASSVTLSRSPEVDAFMSCMFVLAALFTFGLALLALLVFYNIKWRATVVALSADEGMSRVTASGSNPKAMETLEAWVSEEYGARARPWGARAEAV